MIKKLLAFLTIGVLGTVLLREAMYTPRLEAAMWRREIQENQLRFDPAFQGFLSQYTAQVEQQLKEEGVPGAAFAIVVDSTVAVMRAYGRRSVKSRKKVDEHTVFRLASLSKGFTGILAGSLVAEGRLSWEEPVYQHVPALKLKSRRHTEQLQLCHVLSHTTGLPRHTYSNLLNMGLAYPVILGRLSRVSLPHEVGAYHNYQNVAFCLAGDVMETVMKQPFSELMGERLFRPLGMEDASVSFDSLRLGSNIALPHHRTGKGYALDEIDPNYYEATPAAGVNASISDMARWLQLLLGHHPEVVPDAVLDAVFVPFVEIPAGDRVLRNWRPLESAHYGMGWRIFKQGGMEIIQHSGYVNGYRAEIAFLREGQIGIVMLTNAPNYTVGHSIPAFFQSYQEYLTSKSDETSPAQAY